jgi:hypothetical protein
MRSRRQTKVLHSLERLVNFHWTAWRYSSGDSVFKYIYFNDKISPQEIKAFLVLFGNECNMFLDEGNKRLRDERSLFRVVYVAPCLTHCRNRLQTIS